MDTKYTKPEINSGDWLYLAGSRHSILCIDEKNISIGATHKSLAWWRKYYADMGWKDRYTTEQIEEYRLHIEYCGSWLEANKARTK